MIPIRTASAGAPNAPIAIFPPPGMPPGQAVRDRAGLTLEAAAKRARVSPAYLRTIERHGGASFPLAQRLAAIYGNGCRLDVFLSTDPRPNARTRRSR